MNTPKAALSAAVVYVFAFPVCSGIAPSTIPLPIAAALYGLYPLWFGVWLVALVWTALTLSRQYGNTRMAVWWWLSVPYSVGLPAMSLILGLGKWASAHFLGVFFLLAYVTIPSSILWAVAMVTRFSKSKSTNIDRAMFACVPLMVALWIIVLTISD